MKSNKPNPSYSQRRQRLRLNVSTIDNDALVPLVTHDAGDLVSGIVANHGTHHIKRTVDTGSHTAGSKYTQPAKAQVGTFENTLPTSVARFPAHATLPSSAGAMGAIRPIRALFHRRRRVHERALATLVLLVLLTSHDIGILIFILAKVEAQIIHHVALLDHIAAISHIALGDAGAQVFELGDEVWVRGGGEAAQQAGFGEEEGAGADGHEGALTSWIFLLDFGELLDEGQWLGFGFEDLIRAAAGDYEKIDFGKAFHGLVKGHVCTEGGSLGGDRVLFGRCEDHFEGFRICQD